MIKRDFIKIGAGATLAALAPSVRAQAPVAGKDYRIVEPAQRTEAAAGKIEVLEFFWYACPHCYALEPVIHDWASRLPADVEFRRVHVAFRGDDHQQLYYTLLAMDKAEALGPDVFKAIHVENKRMRKADEVADWAAAHGIDRKAFVDTWKSFGVRTAMANASKKVEDYGIDGVPMLAVNGRYLTSPSMVGSNGRALQVVDQLIAKER